MAYTLPKFFKTQLGPAIETSIGTLCLFSISTGEDISRAEMLESADLEGNATEYLKSLLIFVCFPQESLLEGGYKPDKPVLTQEKIEKLPENELDHLAKVYVQHNEYLFKKSEYGKERNSEGEVVRRHKFTEVLHPKEDDESYIEYLYRLHLLWVEKIHEDFQRKLDSLPTFSGFSEALTSSITQSLSQGEALRRGLEPLNSIQVPSTSSFSIEKPSLLSNLHLPDPTEFERKRREPFNDLANRLDKLVSKSEQAINFMVSSNETQTAIGDEIKQSSDATDRHAKKNIRLTNLVIALTSVGLFVAVVGLIVAVATSLFGVSFKDQSHNGLEEYTQELSGSLRLSREIAEDNSNKSNLILSNILESLKNINSNSTSNHKVLVEALQEIDELKASNDKYRKEIEILSKEVERLKRESDHALKS
ncbi:hypothetical protein [Microbulbifer sp. ZKSA002]|uniref:hypothetical protein n=1 Tax=Microbulbifer sp. ZKSA002 TaxID=3243388 RepID=UPI0040390E66